MSHLVATLDLFSNNGIDLPYLLTLPLPFVTDLYDARIGYLAEKRKAQEEEQAKYAR